MATNKEIDELLNVNGEQASKNLMQNMISYLFERNYFDSCIRADITDKEYEDFKIKYGILMNNFSEQKFLVKKDDFNKYFYSVTPYLDINKLYFFLDSAIYSFRNLTNSNEYSQKAILAEKNPNGQLIMLKGNYNLTNVFEKNMNFMQSQLNSRDTGKDFQIDFLFWGSNGNGKDDTPLGYYSYKPQLNTTNFPSRLMRLLCEDLNENEFYSMIDDAYAKRILKKKNFDVVKENFMQNSDLQTIFDRTKLKKLFLDYSLKSYNNSNLHSDLEKFQYAIRYYYSDLVYTRNIIEEENQNRVNPVNIDSEKKDIVKFLKSQIKDTVRNKDDLYYKVMLAEDSKSMKLFRNDIVDSGLLNTKDCEKYLKELYSESKIHDKRLHTLIDEFNLYGLDLDPKDFEYDMSKHAKIFLQNHAEDINKICGTNIVGIDDDERELSEVTEKFYKKLYDEKIKELDENGAKEFAENFAYEISNINEDVLYNLNNGKDAQYNILKYFYEKGYLDYNSVREFYNIDDEDPRNADDIFKRFEKDGVTIRDEDKRDFTNPEHIKTAYNLYKDTDGKRGISGKQIIEKYINGEITDENFDEFLNETIKNNETSKLFTVDVLSNYLSDAERDFNIDDVEKYKLYKKLFDQYANKDNKKDFENLLKSKSKGINFSRVDDCIVKYKLNELTASQINEEYKKIEEKIRIAPSKSAVNQQDTLDELLCEMLRKQNVMSDKDFSTIFLDGTLEKDNNKQRLIRIIENHSDPSKKDYLTHQQIVSTIFKIKPPENEPFARFLTVDDERSGYTGIEREFSGAGTNKPKYDRTTKEFFDRKQFLESFDDDITTEVYGDIVAFNLPNKRKTILEQFIDSSNGGNMALTSKATYVIDNRLFNRLRNGETKAFMDGESVPLFAKYGNDMRINWSALYAIRDNEGVNRVIHNYKADSWYNKVAERVGISKEDVEKYFSDLRDKDKLINND